jgi:hypothetical protein
MPDKKENQTKIDHGKTLLSWKFPEFLNYQRGKTWYVIATVVGAGLVIWSLATLNYLFAIVVVMVGVIVVAQGRRQPHDVVVQISEDGITVAQSFYRYKDIKSFWIVYDPPLIKKLFIDFKSAVRPTLTIQLENENPVNVRRILTKYIDEDIEKDEEPASDSISRLLKI